MDNEKAKILVLVEGAKTDVNLMEKLFSIYGISERHTIVSYNTNIYTLYGQMFSDGHPEDYDLLALLKSREHDVAKKAIFDDVYSDILLIFDLDPHDPQFSAVKISEMLSFFTESSDMGKLYLNYPMVEAFYHMGSIPDPNYAGYTVTMDELRQKAYKERVRRENRNRDFRKFSINRQECNIVIRQNLEKGFMLTQGSSPTDIKLPNTSDILAKQLELICQTDSLSVLCTCAFYIPDYNPNLLK